MDLAAFSVRLISYLATLALFLHLKSRGRVTSGLLFIFWTVSAVFGAATFRSVLMKEEDVFEAPPPLASYLVQYPLVVGLFFLSTWAEPKPRYIDLDGEI